MTLRIVLSLVAVVATALIPMAASGAGVSLFWSQAVGICAGWAVLYFLVVRTDTPTKKTLVPLLMAMALATLVALGFRHVW